MLVKNCVNNITTSKGHSRLFTKLLTPNLELILGFGTSFNSSQILEDKIEPILSKDGLLVLTRDRINRSSS